MVRRRLHPLIVFAAVIAAAGSVTAAGLTFTAHTVSKTVAELPPVEVRTVPSYVVRVPDAKAADLDISKTVEVKPKTPVTVPAVPVVRAAVSPTPTTVETQPTLVAEASPLGEAPADAGQLYRATSDVFMRTGPSKNTDSVGTVAAGTEVSVSDKQGGWLKVSFNGGSGWVYQQYLAPIAAGDVAETDASAAPF